MRPASPTFASASGEVIVTLGDKNITANDLYYDMKEYYSVNVLLEKIDNIILTSIYYCYFPRKSPFLFYYRKDRKFVEMFWILPHMWQ